jgi:GntR family transcriptional regulator
VCYRLIVVSDTTDGRSRQLRIADSLRARIESGEFAPGAKLPGLPVLAQAYQASLVTVRLALTRLKQEGLIISRQGRGNFVRQKPPVRRYGIGRYSRSVWGGDDPQPILIAEGTRQGRTVDQETSTEQVPAPDFVAERLPGVAEGDPVYVRRRTTTIDGVMNQSADSYFTLATGRGSPDLIAGSGAGGHIARINAISPVLEIQEEITSRMPTGPEASRLDIPEGTPVFEVIRTYHTADGPLDVARFVIRADMAVFDYRFPVPD